MLRLLNETEPHRIGRVLVVDDEEPMRGLVDCMLRWSGYDTVLAANGPAALRAIETSAAFDLLLTDLSMPIMTGDELVRRAHLLAPHLKVLYLTGHCAKLQAGTTCRHQACLEKPPTMQGLLAAIASVIGQSEALPYVLKQSS